VKQGGSISDLKQDLEGIYLRLPTPLQNLACSFVGWRTLRTRYGGEFPQILAELQARTYWSTEDVVAFRNRRLAAFLEHAAATVPFYGERLREAGVGPSEIESIEDLRRLPLLTKGDVQENQPRLTSNAISASETQMVHTSGTTGGALRFPLAKRGIQEQWAAWWRYRGWHGISQGTWCGLFAGRSVVPTRQVGAPFWRINVPGRQILFSGYHMSHNNLPAYVDELRRRKPPWLHGYPSLLALLAAYIIESGGDLGYGVRWVTTGAENLLPQQAQLIQRAFAVEPVQHYGLTEGVANISQCELGTLHVDEDFAAVEFIPVDGEGLHRIVGTNLSNLATPLVRYDTQDLATLRAGASCSCGRPGRIVERIDGRLEDYVVLHNGARVGRMDHVFKDMVNIVEAQIHQYKPGELTIRVVRGERFGDADERELRREAAKRVGDATVVEIEYVRDLQRSSTGKLRFVLSEIPEASIDPASNIRVGSSL
jgi:phenylacetate-CoA ligase